MLTIFTGIVAVALLIQSLAFVGIYLSVRDLSKRLDVLSRTLLDSIKSISGKVDTVVETVNGLAVGLRSIQEKVNQTTAVVHDRVVALDAFLAEATDSARLQVLRVQDVIDQASRRIEDTFGLLHSTIMKPVTEVNAIVRGVRVGLDFILRRHKHPAVFSHQDEEMFI